MPVTTKLLSRAAIAATFAIVCGLAHPASAQPTGTPTFAPWGFDLSGVDPKAKPGDSFFDYANGAWDARTEIPPDKVRFGMFDALRDKTEEQLRVLVEDAAKANAAPDTEQGKIGALYNAFMDVVRIDHLDATPIADDLARIRNAGTQAELATLMGRSTGNLGASFFALAVGEDSKDPTRNTLYASQSGLGLPDRDYYLRDAFKDKKAKYRDYVARMLDMVGWPAAQKNADEIVALETRVAQASWTRAESRERDKTYNPK